MPLISKPLTQRMVDATPLPPTGFTELRERGLTLRIYATGAKTWSLEYRSPITGKNSRVPIEASSLAEARVLMHKHRLTLSEGKDPRLEAAAALTVRRAEHRAALPIPEAINKYEKPFLDMSPDKRTSRLTRLQRLRRILAPLGMRAIGSITREEMIGLLDDIQLNSGPIARNRAHAEIRAWLGWLHPRGYVPTNVLAGVRKEISETNRAKTRVFTDAELGAMIAASTDGTEYSDIVRVLLHTGMRKGEVASLQPRDLDFEARRITVRDEVSKNKHERVIPMAEAIAGMLAERANGLTREAYIFGVGSNFASPFSGWGKCTERLRAALPEGDPWTMHDIRRTVGTRLYEAGVDSLVIEDLLGHISGLRGGVKGVYNRSVTFEKQARAVSEWAARLAYLAGERSLQGVASPALPTPSAGRTTTAISLH
jgi:integrase